MISRYKIFHKVLETKSFTQAARELGYSQSAISQTIKSLEQELGTALVSRNKNGIILTKDGELYLPYLSAVHGAEQALVQKRQEMQGLENHIIRIGTFTSVSRNLLPQLMQQFKQEYPDVHFVLQQGDYTNISRWVESGSVDIGFVNTQAVTDLDIQPLYQDEMIAIFSQTHQLAEHSTISLRQLAEEPFILLDEGEYSLPMDAFRQLRLSPNIQYTVYDDYTILAMLRQNLGVSILYRLVLPDFGAGLAIRPIEERLERTIALAWHNWDTLSLAARRFAEFIITHTPALLSEFANYK